MISNNQEDEAVIPEVDLNKGVIVTIYSVHKAKGRSFPIMILPYLDNKLNDRLLSLKLFFGIKHENTAIVFDFIFVNEELQSNIEFG